MGRRGPTPRAVLSRLVQWSRALEVQMLDAARVLEDPHLPAELLGC